MFVLANSWTQVMWQHWFMLLGGNLIIGIIEGAIIAKVFRAPMRRSIPLMIVANYLSMWAGAFVFGISEANSPIPDSVFQIPLYQVSWLLWIGVAVAIAMSIAVEWPFCFALVAPGPRRFGRSFQAVILAQLSSYTCIGLTHFRGENTLNRDVHVVRSINVDSALARAEIYFVNPQDGDVYSIHLDRATLTRQFEADLNGYHDVIAVTMNEAGEPMLIGKAHFADHNATFLNPIPGKTEPFRLDPYGNHPDPRIHGWILGFSGIAEHRPETERFWRPHLRGSAGIQFENIETGETFDVAYDTAFTSWWARCITMLPGDFAIFELGQQICLLHIPSRQITFIARGRSPVVVLPRDA